MRQGMTYCEQLIIDEVTGFSAQIDQVLLAEMCEGILVLDGFHGDLKNHPPPLFFQLKYGTLTPNSHRIGAI